MATVKKGDKEIIVEDGESITSACMELGVPFGCRSGICGTCKIEITDGSENLSDLSEEEKEMGDRDNTHRLACQTKIKSGKVIIKEEE